METLISLDIGSSGARASAFDLDGHLVAEARCAYPTRYPYQGWAEQDAEQWVTAALTVLKKVDQSQAVALALTGQCPTYVPVDAKRRPLGPAMTYQDNRSVVEAAELTQRFGADFIHAFAGHSPQAFFVLPKVLWHRDHEPGLYQQLDQVLQPSDFVAHHLTGELATSVTHACGTLAFDQVGRRWNDGFIAATGLKDGLFPARVLDPWEVVGTLRPSLTSKTGLRPGLPIVMGAPDSQCCCLGVGAITDDVLSNMSGTSTCLNSAVDAMVPDRRVGNYRHVLPGRWSTEMGLNTTGAALSWIAGTLLPGASEQLRYDTIARLARWAPIGAKDLIFLPYLTDGDRDARVKGGFHNLSIAHDGSHLIRAVLEGVAFAERERSEVLVAAGCQLKRMSISGGGAQLNLWNQIKADVTGLPVTAVTGVDATELGAAMLAGIGVGVYTDATDAVARCQPAAKEFMPDPASTIQYEERFQAFVNLERSLAAGDRQPH